MFSEFVNKKRLDLDLSLREFCKRTKEDPSNWSKIERQLLPPPRDKERLKRIAKVLQIEVGSEEWNLLYDYAHINSGIIPEYIMSNQEILEALPAFFRTVGSIKPTKEELEELVKQLKGK